MARTKRTPFFRKILYVCLIAIAALALGMTLFVVSVQQGLFGELPNKEQLGKIRNNLSTEIYSADGKIIGTFYLQERTRVDFTQINESIIHALIATEDARFYDHSGIDYRSLLRVLVKTVIMRDRSGGGGSTLTQQLAKNLFQRENHGLLTIPVAKTKEMIIASRLEDQLSKEEIIELYLNTVPFGDNTYGIETAAKTFFGKPAKEIQIEEAAVLVGMLKANYTYNPRIFPDKSEARRNVVLSQMEKYGYLSDEESEELTALPLQLDYRPQSQRRKTAGYFKERIKAELESWIQQNPKEDGSHYNLYTDGLKVYTTLDSRIQSFAEASVQSHMSQLQRSFDQHWSNEKPWDKEPEILQNALARLPRYKKLKKQKLNDNQILDSLSRPHPSLLFTWKGWKERDLSTLDSLQHYLGILQTAVIAIDPKTGAVLSYIGGNDPNIFPYDRAAEHTRRQVGSTFKPIVYASALENRADPCEFISAGRTSYGDYEDWTPNNADTTENLKKYSFKGALTHSVNTVSVKVLEENGIDEAIYTARRLGIQAELPAVPSIALGTPSISLLEMTRAYAAFANEGQLPWIHSLLRIEDVEGNVLAEFDTEESIPMLSENTAQMITDMLREVVDHGTGGRLRWKYHLTNDLAGKTGTTQSNADGWFIGYNPEIVIGVWVGADDPRIRFRSTALGSGANMALPIFAGIIQKMNVNREVQNIAQARFPPLSTQLTRRLDCENWKEDRTFLEKLFGSEAEEKKSEKEFGEEEPGLFEKIGSIFKKKKK